MRALIPRPLRDYTQADAVNVDGRTLGDVLADLERQFPGLRFRIVDEQNRIRKHIRFFVDGAHVADLDRPLERASEVMIVCALSGG